MTAQHSKGVQGASWINIVLGLLILATPFFTAEATLLPLWSGVIAGVLVIGLAGYNAYVGTKGPTERALAPAALNLVIGIYVLFSPFFMAVSQAYTWAMVAWGGLLAISAAYNTWAASDARHMGGRPV